MIVSILFLYRFTRVAACLFQVREFLGKLDELVGKVSYANDPIKLKKPALQQKTDKLLHDLIKRSPVFGRTRDPPLPLGDGLINDLLFFTLFPFSSFVVETQPSMPQGKGPLVLRTNVQFSVKTRSVWNYASRTLDCTTVQREQRNQRPQRFLVANSEFNCEKLK